MKKVSIIIPYHSETVDAIRPLMKSLDFQAGINFEDLEILLCKDTEVPNEIDQYTFSEYPNIAPYIVKCLAEYKNNPGMSRQAGLDICTGEYAFFCDADDCLFDVLSLRRLIEQIDKKVDADVYRWPFMEEVGSFVDDRLSYLHHGVNWIWVFGKAYKVSFLKEHNIRFNPKLRWHEDTYFNLLCRYSNAKAVNLDGYNYLWKFSKTSITRVNDHEYTFNSIPDYLLATAEAFEVIATQYKVDVTNDILGVITRYYYTLNDPTNANKAMLEQVERCYYNFVRRVACGLFNSIPAEFQSVIVRTAKNLDFNYLPSLTLEEYLKHLANKYGQVSGSENAVH